MNTQVQAAEGNQNFRSIEEVKRYLKDQASDIAEFKTVFDKQMTQMARMVARAITASGETQILDFSGSGGRRKKTMNVDFPVVEVPNKEKLREHYKLTELLSEHYKNLTQAENAMRMDFAGDQSPAFKEAMGSFNKLKSHVEAMLKEVFTALNQIAEGHAPKQYLKFVKALADELEANKHIECDGLQTMTYASLDGEDNLVFAGYIILLNAVSDDQKIVPHLYIVIKWTVGGNVELFIEHDFVAPGLLKGGIVIESLRAAAAAIATQMALEGFSSQIGNLPVSMQIKEPAGGLCKEAFSAADWIEDVKGEEDALVFVLKTSDPKQVSEIRAQIYAQVREMLKRKRSTYVKIHQDGPNVLRYTFSNIEHGGGIHPHDLEWLRDKYKLGDAQLRKIANNINSGE